MSELEIGNVVIAAEGDRLTFTRSGEPLVSLNLDGEGLGELLDFLRSVRVDQQNRRRGFRVPVVSSRFQTHLEPPFEMAVVRARDVSLSGIFLEFPEGIPNLDINDDVEIAIAYGNDDARLSGTVRRRTEKGLGIVFAHAANTAAPTPPPTLERIVMLLEKEWLRARLTA